MAPVVPEGGAQMVGIAQRLADVDHVVVGPVARRPVAPDVLDELEVVLPDPDLDPPLHLEIPKIKALLDLAVGAEVLAEDVERRDVDDDGLRYPRVTRITVRRELRPFVGRSSIPSAARPTRLPRRPVSAFPCPPGAREGAVTCEEAP